MMTEKKPYTENFIDYDFENTLMYQPYFSYSWIRGTSEVHNSILNTISNWAGECTDPSSGMHYYNNPAAMFSALDMIYKLIQECEKGRLSFNEEIHGEHRGYDVPQIKNHCLSQTITEEKEQ